MDEVKVLITKEEFDNYIDLDRAELNNIIEPTVPAHWKCGYGWYGCYLSEDLGRYYIVHKLGSGCD